MSSFVSSAITSIATVTAIVSGSVPVPSVSVPAGPSFASESSSFTPTITSLPVPTETPTTTHDFVTSSCAHPTTISHAGAKCAHLNFGFKGQGRYYPSANGKVVDVVEVGDNEYEIVYQFEASERCPPISNLDQAKIIGIKSPQGSEFLLHDSNKRVSNIKHSCNWAAKFVVNGEQHGSQVCIPSFQIHYSWFSGRASRSHKSHFHFNDAYEYMIGCAHDNNNNAQADFPLYCWDPSGPSSSSSSFTEEHTTEMPTTVATEEPTSAVTEEPTSVDTEEPTTVATEEPTTAATEPTTVATEDPTTVATEDPTTAITEDPTTVATEDPTTIPIEEPTTIPSSVASNGSSGVIPAPSVKSPATTVLSIASSSNIASPTTTSPSQFKIRAQAYGQCGGKSHFGATECVENWSCKSQNPYYYQCVEIPKTTTKEENCMSMWGQCGGLGFKGYTDCCGDAVCVTQNRWYAHCTTTYSII